MAMARTQVSADEDIGDVLDDICSLRGCGVERWLDISLKRVLPYTIKL